MRHSLIATIALFALAGCQAKIGDECERSTDCSLRGERVCDLSHRVTTAGIVTPSGKGECTIDGCGRDSCPKEAACIKVYGSNFLSVSCDPDREDLATVCDREQWSEQVCADRGCVPSTGDDWTCPPRDDCDVSEVCLPEGLCADEITARTSCRFECTSNRDCRNGYECLLTGSQGIYRAPDVDDPSDRSSVRICMPARG